MDRPSDDRLDLSIFRLPVEVASTAVEIPISSRHTAQATSKRVFWRRLARRVDLTGEGCPPDTPLPYPSRFNEARKTLLMRHENLADTIQAKYQPDTQRDLFKSRDLQTPPGLARMLPETTPQFFLRNVPRVERDANIARPPLIHAIWSEDSSEYFEELRYPTHKPPELLDELSTQWLPKLGKELHSNVQGFEWAYATEAFTEIKARRLFIPRTPTPPISINELSLDPAPAYRPTKEDIHLRTLKELAKRFDGSR